MNTQSSAIYEGRIQHRRYFPHAHAFSYRTAQLYLDLAEVESVFKDRWLWSVERSNLASFRRSDFHGDPTQALSDTVRESVYAVTGERPEGPIRMLAHLRYGGYSFNPVTFYFCYTQTGALHSILAEITNTPWKERHAYVLPVAEAQQRGRAFHWSFDKRFHVSPFMPLDRQYEWSFTPPEHDLRVHMAVNDNDTRQFDANLALVRRPLDSAQLARLLLRYPLMTTQVITGIHWQALRLWLKGNPVYDHPNRQEINK